MSGIQQVKAYLLFAFHVEWVTDELLGKIEKDPVLSEAFRDPAMTQALAQFQLNPQAALEAAKDKPKVRNATIVEHHCRLKTNLFHPALLILKV